jgi:CheY-like chemotaxis protein
MSMSNLHALIIDDDVNNLEILSRLLSVEQITYTTVQDPTQLSTVVPTLEKIDIVFLDLEMPKLNGYEVFELLKSLIGSEVPIVAHTVHVSEINVAKGLGFHSFVGKPLNAKRFPDQLRRILSNQPVWEPK